MNNCKDEIIINGLLSYPTIREASRNIGIPESTVYNRLRDASFQSKYTKAKSEMLTQSCGYLRARVADATDTIVSVMADKDVPPQSRISAARTVLQYALKLTETTEILQRLEALEDQEESCT